MHYIRLKTWFLDVEPPQVPARPRLEVNIYSHKRLPGLSPTMYAWAVR